MEGQTSHVLKQTCKKSFIYTLTLDNIFNFCYNIVLLITSIDCGYLDIPVKKL